MHYRGFSGSDTDGISANARAWSAKLEAAGLPCRNFYNYASRDTLPCAEADGAWRAARVAHVGGRHRVATGPRWAFLTDLLTY